MQIAEDRIIELVDLIADNLTDLYEEPDETRPENLSYEENMQIILDYGTNETCGTIVINAIRHAQDMINFWNKSAMQDWLAEIGFTEPEIEYYYGKWIAGN